MLDYILRTGLSLFKSKSLKSEIIKKNFSCDEHNHAIILIEAAFLHKPKAQTLVKSLCADIAFKRVNDNRCYIGVCKTSFQCKSHYRCSIAFAQSVSFANPNINRPQIRLTIAPIVRFFQKRVDDLHHSNRFALRISVHLSNKLLAPIRIAVKFLVPMPIVLNAGCHDVWLFFPFLQYCQIIRCCGAKSNCCHTTLTKS